MSAHRRRFFDAIGARHFLDLIASWTPPLDKPAVRRRQMRVLGLVQESVADAEETREIPRVERASIPEIRHRRAA